MAEQMMAVWKGLDSFRIQRICLMMFVFIVAKVGRFFQILWHLWAILHNLFSFYAVSAMYIELVVSTMAVESLHFQLILMFFICNELHILCVKYYIYNVLVLE